MAPNIAKYKSLTEWDAKEKAEFNYQELRCEDDNQTERITAFKIREEKETAYWTSFLKEQYYILPESKETFKHDLGVKMKYLYDERKREFNF